ncbi:MAG: tyrosine-type recombinase/integrase [Lachnospiraceae bacterium]|nr:tyrosine-type recombinase/integrase [Lachnospiraceae bacterium]
MSRQAQNGDTPFLTDDLLVLLKTDKMETEDARKLYREMEKQIILRDYTFPDKPSSDGFYHIYVTDPTKKSGRRAIKAKTIDALKDKVYAHEKGINGKARKTFKEVFGLSQSEKLKYAKSEERQLSVFNTIGRNDSEYRRFFAGTAFERMYIDEITKKDVDNITYQVLSRYDLTDKGFLSYRGLLKATFDLAYEEYWIADNVYNRVNFKKYKDMLKEPTPIEERLHTDKEIEDIIAYVRDKHRKSPGYMPAYALELQLIMGLRRGEVLALKWSDVFEDHILIRREQITVNPSKYTKGCDKVVEHTKTRRNRKYPKTRQVIALLEQLKAVNGESDSEFLFPSDNVNGIVSNNALYKFYRRTCDALDIPICKECIKGTHSFRRNAETKVVNQSGGNIIMAAKLFGHSPAVAEKNYYTGLDMTKAKAVLES